LIGHQLTQIVRHLRHGQQLAAQTLRRLHDPVARSDDLEGSEQGHERAKERRRRAWQNDVEVPEDEQEILEHPWVQPAIRSHPSGEKACQLAVKRLLVDGSGGRPDPKEPLAEKRRILTLNAAQKVEERRALVRIQASHRTEVDQLEPSIGP
jgi:hypothetical protein